MMANRSIVLFDFLSITLISSILLQNVDITTQLQHNGNEGNLSVLSTVQEMLTNLSVIDNEPDGTVFNIDDYLKMIDHSLQYFESLPEYQPISWKSISAALKNNPRNFVLLEFLKNDSLHVPYSYRISNNVQVAVINTAEFQAHYPSSDSMSAKLLSLHTYPRDLTFFDAGIFSSQMKSSFYFPKASDVEFELFTRDDRQKYLLKIGDFYNLQKSSFDRHRKTVVVAHGFTGDTSQFIWMNETLHAFLNLDYNVILVQWKKLSGKWYGMFQYAVAVRNTSFVGKLLADLLQFLKDFGGLSPDTVHMIGFSLGAHVVGFAGKRFPGCGRITGLDPAGPVYNDLLPSERLAKTDANFVDIVHTSSKMYGMDTSIGHIDFYINDGSFQPQCDFMENIFGCSHAFAPNIFTKSIQWHGIPAKAYKCNDNKTDFMTGVCLFNNMNYFGLYASELEQGNFYLDTLDMETPNSGYLAAHYLFSLEMRYQNESRISTERLLITVYDEENNVHQNIKVIRPGFKHKAEVVTMTHVVKTPLEVELKNIRIDVSYKSSLANQLLTLFNMDLYNPHEPVRACPPDTTLISNGLPVKLTFEICSS